MTLMQFQRYRLCCTYLAGVIGLVQLCLVSSGPANAQPKNESDPEKITLVLRSVELSEVMEMLSRSQRVNILLSGDVSGKVTVNLYDVALPKAIESIAAAAGYAVE